MKKEKITDLLEKAKHKCRKLEYYMILNLFENHEAEIILELAKFQNEDGGFGHGLEPDIRMPESNVASSDVAIAVLDEIKDEGLKRDILKKLVSYYEDVFNEDKLSWEIVPPMVDNYPRAVWWNYENVDSFSYGNPNPEIVGFLFRYKQYLKKIDVFEMIERIVGYVQTEFPDNSSQHSIISSLYFYVSMPEEIKKQIKDNLQKAIDKELHTDNWEEYGLEPYSIYLITKDFLENRKEILDKNIKQKKAIIKKGLILPNWQWYQYEEVFNNIKHEWSGLLTYKAIKAIIKFEKEND